MLGRKLTSGAYGSILYERWECCGEHIHLLAAQGPIRFEDRHAAYLDFLKTNPSSTFIAVMDNRRGFEDEISFEKMLVIAATLQSAGIKRMIGVAITKESGYDKIVKLSHAVADIKGMKIVSATTTNMNEVKEFLMSQIQTSTGLSCTLGSCAPVVHSFSA